MGEVVTAAYFSIAPKANDDSNNNPAIKLIMKIAYVTTDDARDIHNWSGLRYYIGRSLEMQGCQIEYIGPLDRKTSWYVSLKSWVHHRIIKKTYLLDRESIILKDYARQISARLATIKPDIVFSTGTIPIAYLDCPQPIAFWTDATFAGAIDFLRWFHNLSPHSIAQGHQVERAALSRVSLACYASYWAADTAAIYQPTIPVHVVPFGANIESNRTIADIKTMLHQRSQNECKLLFIGVAWLNKGGNIALSIAQALNNAGLKTTLTLVGCIPPENHPIPDFVHVTGFIKKSTPEGRAQLDRLFAEAHFLLAPSRTEAYGLVNCEANSFGVPALASDVGGIPTIIKNDVNGHLFSLEAGPDAYAAYIADIMNDYQRYEQLALSAFNEYETRLNWSVSGQKVKQLLEQIQ